MGSQMATGKALVLRELESGKIGDPAKGVRALGHAGSPSATSYYESLNWAGYADNDSGGAKYTYAAGSWKQPAITKKCKTVSGLLAVTSTWVGLDGWTDKTVEQAGTTNVCDDGTAFAFDWYEMYPAGSVGVSGIGATDSITAVTSTNGAGQYTLTVEDSTNPSDGFSVDETCSTSTCLDSSAEWISEAPCCSGETSSGFYPLAPFKTWKLEKASSNGNTISFYPNDNIIEGNYDYAYPLQTTGSLGGKGTKFEVTYKASD